MLEVEEWALKSRSPQSLERGLPDMPVSMAQQRATAKFKKNNYDRMEILLAPKGRKAELQAHAKEFDESLNGFVNRAIDCQMERDNTKDGEAN